MLTVLQTGTHKDREIAVLVEEVQTVRQNDFEIRIEAATKEILDENVKKIINAYKK